jgi:hypothetical protein
MQNQLPNQAWQDRFGEVTENSVPADPLFQLAGILTRHGYDFQIPMHVFELSYNLFAAQAWRTGQRKVNQEQINVFLLSCSDAASSGGYRHDPAPAHFQRGSNCFSRQLIVFRKEHFHFVSFSLHDPVLASPIGKSCANISIFNTTDLFY